MNWNNVSIGKYQEIIKSKKSGLDLISLMTGRSIDELEELSAKQLSKLATEFEFLNHEPIGDFKERLYDYRILDMKHPKTGGSMIDFLEILEQNEFVKNLHILMATLLVKNEKEDFEQKCEWMKWNVPITIGYGVAGFFLTNFEVSPRTIPFYFQQVKKGRVSLEKLLKRLEDLKQTTNGISGLTS